MRAQRESKTCAVCGRTITWRKKWERDWDAVRYCSDSCRRNKAAAADTTLEDHILSTLSQRAATATICPSEVARDLGADQWRELMEPVRQAARRLVARGEVEITQRGTVVDPSTAKGPIRIRRVRRPSAEPGGVHPLPRTVGRPAGAAAAREEVGRTTGTRTRTPTSHS